VDAADPFDTKGLCLLGSLWDDEVNTSRWSRFFTVLPSGIER
jgi:hypothetical protein